MRYFTAHCCIGNEDDVDLTRLHALYTPFDDKVFVLPYRRRGWSSEGEVNFAVTLIFKDGAVTIETAEEHLNVAMDLWGIEGVQAIRLEETTIEACFMAYGPERFDSCAFDEDQIQRLLNLRATCSFIAKNRNGLKEHLIEKPLTHEKALQRARDTEYGTALAEELERIFAEPALCERNAFAPIVYVVEGDAVSDAEEVLDIVSGALKETGRVESGHVLTLNFDEYKHWPSSTAPDHRLYLNSQLIRALEGNTLVIRYGLFDSATSFDVSEYQLLVRMLDLIDEAACSTQLMLSVPEGNPDLIMRLRRRIGKPMVMLRKDAGTALREGSFQGSLKALQRMARSRGMEPDDDMGKLLSRHMRGQMHSTLEAVFDKWLGYRNARAAHPQYASVIDEAIDLDVHDGACSAQARLDDLIGLDGVKEHIRSIIQRVEMNQRLLEKGLPQQPFSMHMAFLGSPGTGKTEVARLYAEILKDHGVLSEGRLVTVSGGSGFKVREAFAAAKGSVLFVDEAYGMHGYPDMVTEFIAQMENNRRDTVVILAGYLGHMNALLDSNPGFRSRIGSTIMFPDYSAEELHEIFAFMCAQHQMVLDAGVDEVVRDVLARGGHRADQGNARFVRKVFEDAVGAQQVRLAKRFKDGVSDHMLDDLRTLTVEDVEKATGLVGPRKEGRATAREELEALVGLAEVKELVSARMDFARMQKVKRDAGLDMPFIPMHMAFKGNPGTGKTEVARLIGRILHEEGVLSVGDFYECGKQDLVCGVVGASAAAVEGLFQKARGSVIFIDEAYSLADGGGSDEAITALIDQMEKLRDEVVVIFAGYTTEMEKLFATNPGFASRVKVQITFPDYRPEELIEILHHMVDAHGCTLAADVDEKVTGILAHAVGQKDLGNARFMRNLLEDALVAQSVRLAQGDVDRLSVEELSELRAEDFSWEAPCKAHAIGFAA